MSRPFWIDTHYDHQMASDGVSRYHAYLRARITALRSEYDAGNGAGFAAESWRIATSPIMSPGYVRTAGRVRAAMLGNSHYDRSLQASVELAAPPPAGLTGWDWVAWQDWPTDSAGQFVDPGEDDVAQSAFLLTTVRLLFTLRTPTEYWPASRSVHAICQSAAQTVANLVRQLNDITSPAIADLEDDSR